MAFSFKIPTAVERAAERAIVVAAIAGLTSVLGAFNDSTAIGLAGYFGVKTLIDYLNPLVPNTNPAPDAPTVANVAK